MRLLCYCWRICVRMSTECGGNLTLGLQKKNVCVLMLQTNNSCVTEYIFYNVECLFVLRILEWNCIHCSELGVTKDKITIKDGMDFFFITREAHPLTIFNDTLKIEILGFDSFIGLRLNRLFSVHAQICYVWLH